MKPFHVQAANGTASEMIKGVRCSDRSLHVSTSSAAPEASVLAASLKDFSASTYKPAASA